MSIPHSYLTTIEAAKLLRISPQTLERRRCEGTGPKFCKAGPGLRARVLYSEADLQDWLKSFTFSATSQYQID